MAFMGVDDNNDNGATSNFSTGNGGNTDWASYFQNYFNNQHQQQQQPTFNGGQQQGYDSPVDASQPNYDQYRQQQSQPRFGSTDTLNGQPYGQQQQGGTFRGGYGFDNQQNPYGQYNQPQQEQVSRTPAQGQGRPPYSYMGDMSGSNQITGFLGPYNRQMQQGIERYAQGLPQPGGMGQGQQQPQQKTAAQFGQEPLFQQALETNVQHPGWNQGEAGPPGTPDFVRNPDKYGQQGWEQRYQYFAQHPEQAMPDWKPVNQWYQQQDPQAIAQLQALAGGQSHNPYMTAAGAASQLAQWGQQGAGQMESGNPQNPMGILHKDGMRYDVATGKNLGPDALPRPAYGGGGGGGGYAPRTYSSGGGGSKALPPPAAKAEPLHPMAPSGYGQFFDQYGNPQYNNVISNRDDPDYWRAYYYAMTKQPNTVTPSTSDREQNQVHPL